MNSKNMNIAALAAGAIGLIACFMPLMMGVTLIDAAKMDGSLYMAPVGFAVAVVCAGLALKNGDFSKQLAIGVVVGSGLALLKVRDAMDAPEIAGKLLVLGAVLGLVAGGIGISKAGGGDAPAAGDGGGEA